MFATWTKLRGVFGCENIALQIGEVDDFGTGFLHPFSRCDVVGDKGGPDRGSAETQVRA